MAKVEVVLPLSEYGNKSLGYIEQEDGYALPVIVISGKQPGLRKAVSDSIDQKRQAVLISKEESEFDDDLRETFMDIVSEYKRSGEISADRIHRELRLVVDKYKEKYPEKFEKKIRYVPYPPFEEDTENRPKGELKYGPPITDEEEHKGDEDRSMTHAQEKPYYEQVSDQNDGDQGGEPDQNDGDQGGEPENPPRTSTDEDEDYLNQ